MIGDRLREERERLDLTQPAFAAIANAKKRTLIDWEKGVSSPTAVQLAALIEAGVDGLYVLTGQRSATHVALAQLRTATEVAQHTEGTPAEQAAVQEELFAQMQALPPRVRALVQNYQAAPEEGKRHIEGAASLASQVPKKPKAA